MKAPPGGRVAVVERAVQAVVAMSRGAAGLRAGLGGGTGTLAETLLMRRVHASNISTTMPVKKPLVLGMLRAAIARKRGGGEGGAT